MSHSCTFFSLDVSSGVLRTEQRTGAVVFFSKYKSECHVDGENSNEANTGNPDEYAMTHGLQKFAIFVDGFWAHEYKKVAGHVAEHKADE